MSTIDKWFLWQHWQGFLSAKSKLTQSSWQQSCQDIYYKARWLLIPTIGITSSSENFPLDLYKIHSPSFPFLWTHSHHFLQFYYHSQGITCRFSVRLVCSDERNEIFRIKCYYQYIDMVSVSEYRKYRTLGIGIGIRYSFLVSVTALVFSFTYTQFTNSYHCSVYMVYASATLHPPSSLPMSQSQSYVISYYSCTSPIILSLSVSEASLLHIKPHNLSNFFHPALTLAVIALLLFNNSVP